MKTKCCNTQKAHRAKKGAICLNTGCHNYLGYTRMIMEYKKLKYTFAVSVFVFYMLFTFNHFSMDNKSEMHTVNFSTKQQAALTLENLKKELYDQEVLCAPEVLAQIKIESAHLSSFLLQHTNNMLGMRYPFSRKTTACGIYIPAQDTIITGTQTELKKYRKTGNYAVYASWQDAVADYKLWQDSCFKVTERYLDFLGNVYAEDSLYVKKIKQVAAKQKI